MRRKTPSDADAPLRGPLYTSRWFLGAVVASILVAFLVGSLLGRSFLSPTQRAAQAAPPAASTLTAPVRSGELVDGAVIRADVRDADPVAVMAPAAVAGDSAVVTRAPLERGEQVRVGTRALEVAMRPVFVFPGSVPAFRTMSVGVRGVDVEQLQAGLLSLGHGVGSDTRGTYGKGTAAAVASFYRERDAQVAWVEGAAGAAPDAPQENTDGEEPDDAEDQAKEEDEEKRRATVPEGEIVFVPKLPARVLASKVSLGARVPEGGALEIGSGVVRITGTIDEVTFARLRVGMSARAESEVLGSKKRLRVSGLRAASAGSSESGQEGSGADSGPRVALKPVGRLPAKWVGQNVAVTISIASSDGEVLIVPAAAVNTDASGQTYVSVESALGDQQRKVPVDLGIASSGEQAVTAADPAVPLAEGDEVVLGRGGG